MHRIVWQALAAAILFVAAGEGAGAVDSVQVGRTRVALPNVSGLIRNDSPTVRYFGINLLTPGKRLLTVWVDRTQALHSGAFFPVHFRYALAYTMSSLESRSAGPVEFSQVKNAVKADIADMRLKPHIDMPDGLEVLKSRLRKMGIDPARGGPGPVSVEELKEDDRRMGFVALEPVLQHMSSGAIFTWMLMCSNVVLVNGKVITINVLSEFSGRSDRDWVDRQCGELVDAVVVANGR